MKKLFSVFMLIAVLFTCASCHENPSQQQLYSKLITHFERFGFSCAVQPVQANREVPIYQASAWSSLMLDQDELLVYFDESNRADYLAGFVDESLYGNVFCFGQRFVLVYAGQNAAVLEALESIENRPI